MANMQITDTQRVAARKFIKALMNKYPDQPVDLMLEAAIMEYRKSGNTGMLQATEVIRQVYYEDLARCQNGIRSAAPEEAQESLSFSRKVFCGLVLMVLFVVFCSGYEGARRVFLAEDMDKVVKLDSASKMVESQLGSYASNRDWALATLRTNAKSGGVMPRRNLGLLCLTGRGGVEDPRSEPVMLRNWNLFSFSFYFGMVGVAYYILRPLFYWTRKRRGCVSSLFLLVACYSSVYFPGMIVFHYVRQWYPAFSAWMTRMASVFIQ